jgi:MFS family permease
VYWLIPGFFLFAVAFGGILVPRLNLVLTLVCRKYIAEQAAQHPEFTFIPVIILGNNPQCRVPEIQALATRFTLYQTLLAGILSAAVSPKLGSLSDRYGRKYLLSFTILGGLLSEAVTIAAASYPDAIPYPTLLLGNFFEGLSGSFIAAMALTHSYASDCTPPSRRAVAFGYIHACLFGGIAIGPFLAAYVERVTGHLIWVFYVAFACHVVFLVYLLLLIPESLVLKRQKAARARHAALRGETEDSHGALMDAVRRAILEPLRVLYPTGRGSTPTLRLNLICLSAVNTIIFGIAMGAGSVIVFYLNYAFNWTTVDIQMYVGATSATRVGALIIVLPALNYVFRTRYRNRMMRDHGVAVEAKNSGSDNVDLYTIRIALLFEVVGLTGFLFARRGSIFFASGLITAFGGIASPVLTSALSKHVPQDRVGQLLGALGLLHALARVVCPTIFSLIYASTVATFPQAVFVLLVASMTGAFIFSLFVKPHSKFLVIRLIEYRLGTNTAAVYLDDEDSESSEDEERQQRFADELEDEDVVLA